MKWLILSGIIILQINLAWGATITLKSGMEVKGRILERGSDYVKMDIEGVDVTFYADEIKGGLPEVPKMNFVDKDIEPKTTSSGPPAAPEVIPKSGTTPRSGTKVNDLMGTCQDVDSFDRAFCECFVVKCGHKGVSKSALLATLEELLDDPQMEPDDPKISEAADECFNEML